jgi:hypothetical protein
VQSTAVVSCCDGRVRGCLQNFVMRDTWRTAECKRARRERESRTTIQTRTALGLWFRKPIRVHNSQTMARHSSFAREKRAQEQARSTMREGQYVAPNRTPTPFGESKECVKPIRNKRNRYQAPRTYRLGVAERNMSGTWIHDRTPAACGALRVDPVQSGTARSHRWFLKTDADGYTGGKFVG